MGGFGPDQPVARVIQDGFEHGEVFRLIVHDQNVDGYVNRKILMKPRSSSLNSSMVNWSSVRVDPWNRTGFAGAGRSRPAVWQPPRPTRNGPDKARRRPSPS